MLASKDLVGEDDANPYIALADLAINLVLVLAFFVAAVNALGRAGWEQVRYKELQKDFRAAVNQMPEGQRPTELLGKNDPPGVQRWVFSGRSLFAPGSARLLVRGSTAENPLNVFAPILRKHRSSWRRIRIEGHTMPPQSDQPDDWELSAQRAAVVARTVTVTGHIPAYYLAVAGRAGQDPVNKRQPGDPRNERIEILVEYSQKPVAP